MVMRLASQGPARAQHQAARPAPPGPGHPALTEDGSPDGWAGDDRRAAWETGRAPRATPPRIVSQTCSSALPSRPPAAGGGERDAESLAPQGTFKSIKADGKRDVYLAIGCDAFNAAARPGVEGKDLFASVKRALASRRELVREQGRRLF